MAYSRGAACAAFAVLVVLARPGTASAEIGRNAFKMERLIMQPLGAGGAVDPIARATRRVEEGIEKSATSGLPASVLERLTRRRAGLLDAHRSEATLLGTPAPSASSAREKQWPLLLDGRRLIGTPLGSGVVLAALDSGKGRATRSDAMGLPRLPPLLSTPDTPRLPLETMRLEPMLVTMPRMPSLPLELRASIVLRPVMVPFVSRRERLSRRALVALSYRPEPTWRVTPAATSRAHLDPLGQPEFALTPRAQGPAFIMPFENGHISSLYNQGRHHPAIDLAGRHGSPVFATSSGQTVIFAGSRGGYGNAVITRDKEGREHLYGHLSAINTRVGTALSQGDRLGALGSTGFSTGPHVHYEVKDRRGAHINPVTLLFPGRAMSTGYAWSGTGLVRQPASLAALRVRE